MSERRSDRVVSIALSILVHAAIVGALLWGWWQYRQPAVTPQNLAIEATVVRDAPPTPAAAAPSAQPPPDIPPPPAPTPTQPTPTPPAPTPPAPDEQAQQQAREQQAQADQAAREKLEQEHAAQERAQQERAAQEKHAAQEQAERAAAEKAEADRAAAAKAEAERAAAAKAKADAEAERKAQLAQQRKLEQERAQREADLRAQLASEEHLNAVQSSPAKAEYLSLITARINRAWIRPPSARSGVKCSLHITQIPGGEITHVVVAGCNGDEALRQSVETAAYRASPLPAPSDPALFDPNIDVTFAPDE
jgi:colicin import membrane protein